MPGQQTLIPAGSATTHILLLHIDDQSSPAEVADGKELHVLVPAKFLRRL